MRTFLLLSCYALILFIVSACGNTTDATLEDKAIEHGKEFITELYTIDNADFDFEDVEATLDLQDEFLPYFTDEEFENLAIKRFFIMPQEAANAQDSTISVKEMELESYERDDVDEDAVNVEHEFTLVLTDQDGNEVEEFDITGQMTVIETEDGLKIDRYHDSKIPVEMGQE